MANLSNRYYKAGMYSVVRADGVTINVYGRRDNLDSQDNTPYTISTLTRLDLIAFDAYGDERLYWAISDQSPNLDPFDFALNPGTIVVVPSQNEIDEYTE